MDKKQYTTYQTQNITHFAAVKLFWKNIFKFNSRASKKEYLHGFLFSLYFIVLLTILLLILGGSSIVLSIMSISSASYVVPSGFTLLFLFFILIVFFVFGIGTLRLQIARLRDTGMKNFWVYIFSLVPLVLNGAVSSNLHKSSFESLLSFVLLIVSICNLVICFARHSASDNTLTYFDVLKANEKYQQKKDEFDSYATTTSNQDVIPMQSYFPSQPTQPDTQFTDNTQSDTQFTDNTQPDSTQNFDNQNSSNPQ